MNKKVYLNYSCDNDHWARYSNGTFIKDNLSPENMLAVIKFITPVDVPNCCNCNNPLKLIGAAIIDVLDPENIQLIDLTK